MYNICCGSIVILKLPVTWCEFSENDTIINAYMHGFLYLCRYKIITYTLIENVANTN